MEPKEFHWMMKDSEEAFFSHPNIDLNAVGDLGKSLLQQAILGKKLKIANALIDLGVGLNSQDRDGKTPLHYAISYDLIGIALHLLRAGANPNIADRFGNNALWAAVVRYPENYELTRELIARGAQADLLNRAGKSTLSLVEEMGDRELLAICGGSVD